MYFRVLFQQPKAEFLLKGTFPVILSEVAANPTGLFKFQ